MKKYRYQGLARPLVLLQQIWGLGFAFLGTLGAGYLIYGALQHGPTNLLCPGIIAAILLLITWNIGLSLTNMSPTIWLTDDHLVISAFAFARVRIPWTEIIEISDPLPFPMDGAVVILAKQITPFHLYYGMAFARSSSPGFLIHKGMQERDELLREIRRRAVYAPA